MVIKQEKIRKSFSIVFIGKVVRMLLTLIVTMILSRLLTGEEFGLMSIALTIIGVSDVFCRGGLGPALIQKQDIDSEHISSALTFSIFLGIIFSFLIYFLSPLIALFYNNIELVSVIKSLSIIFFFSSISNVSYSLLQKKMKFAQIAIIDLVSYILYAIVGIILAINDYEIQSLIYANLAQIVVQSILSILLNGEKITFSFNWNKIKDLLNYGIGHTVAHFFNYISLQGDVNIIGKKIGMNEAGIYNRAYQIMVMPTTLIGQVIDTVLFPYFSKKQNEVQVLRMFYVNGMKLVFILTIPITVYFYFFSEDIIYILLGDKWMDVVNPLKVLALGLFFRTGYKISESIIKSKGYVKVRMMIQIIYAFNILIFCMIGSKFGIIGTAIGVTVAILIHYFLNLFVCIRILSLKKNKNLNFCNFILSNIIVNFIPLIIVYLFAKKITENSFVIIVMSVPVLLLLLYRNITSYKKQYLN